MCWCRHVVNSWGDLGVLCLSLMLSCYLYRCRFLFCLVLPYLRRTDWAIMRMQHQPLGCL
jgi:hypothetical protein